MSWKKGKINLPDYNRENMKIFKKKKSRNPSRDRSVENRPQWNSYNHDLDQYKLTDTELL